jgi:Rieske Fe-S protein
VFNVGAPTLYPANGLYKVTNPEATVLIGRDAGGLYALSSFCTHQCCDLDQCFHGIRYGTLLPNGIQCNCHGSVFAFDGTVISGPAALPLAPYLLTLAGDGNLYVDTTQVVARTKRI